MLRKASTTNTLMLNMWSIVVIICNFILNDARPLTFRHTVRMNHARNTSSNTMYHGSSPPTTCVRNPHLCKGMPLVYPKEIDVSKLPNNHVEISLQPFQYDGYPATFMTRAYAVNNEEPTIPGPVLRVQRGLSFSITMINALEENDPEGPTGENELRKPNTTNLHTHGLHENPLDPADNVLVSIEPGENRTYQYKITNSHMPGIHWYHPHYHGSSALQVGGGALGTIIIDEDESQVPSQLLNMDTKIMMFQNFYMSPDDALGIVTISQQTKDKLVFPTYQRSNNPGVDELDDSWWTINGCYEPVIAMERNKPMRWRIVSGSTDQVLELNVPGCSFELLAKDGVFVSPAPRPVSIVYLSPASRADIIITCSETGVHFLMSGKQDSYSQNNTLKDHGVDANIGESNSSNQPIQPSPPTRPPRPGPGYPQVGQLATLLVSPSVSPPAEKVPPFTPALPNYLADLQDPPPDLEIHEWNLSLAVQGLNLNGISFDQESPLAEFPTGALIEWHLNRDHSSGGQRHPLHVHVWPFQIVDLPKSATLPDYFRVGDWHDTIQVGLEEAAGSEAVVRFQTGRFHGTVVLHCHILGHEDKGMMGTVIVTGDPTREPISSQQTRCWTLDDGPCCKGNVAKCGGLPPDDDDDDDEDDVKEEQSIS